jgi:DNA-binding response OmpR family regulator
LENRILIVDDEKMVYSVIARRLAKEGYACVMANNGREAPSQGLPC